MNFNIVVKDINKLKTDEVSAIWLRLSHEEPSRLNDNMRCELHRRYHVPEPEPQKSIQLALVWFNYLLSAWVATRPWKEKFKGEEIDVQTVECFTDPELRNRGLAMLGLQALISAGVVDRNKPIAVYSKPAERLAARCGCTFVILCDP
jgi:hypothetical protein